MKLTRVECPICGCNFEAATQVARDEGTDDETKKIGVCSFCASPFVIDKVEPMVVRMPTPDELRVIEADYLTAGIQAAIRKANEERGINAACRCWWCGHAGTNVRGERQPAPPIGTPTVCALCLAFGVVTGSMRGTRAATTAERVRLAGDSGVREHVEALRKLQREVREHVQAKYGKAHPYPPEPTDADYETGKRGFPTG